MVVSGRTLGTIQFFWHMIFKIQPCPVFSDLSVHPILLELSSERKRVHHSWPNARKTQRLQIRIYNIENGWTRQREEITHDWKQTKRTKRNRWISPAASQHLIWLKFTANWIQVPHANVFSWCGRAASSTWGSLIACLPSLQHAPSIMRLLATWLQIFPPALRAVADQRSHFSNCTDQLLFGEEHSAYHMAYAAAKHTWNPETALHWNHASHELNFYPCRENATHASDEHVAVTTMWRAFQRRHCKNCHSSQQRISLRHAGPPLLWCSEWDLLAAPNHS